MNYIVFDLEFNQAFKSKRKNKDTTNPGCRFEIIQIGAVKLDESLKIISTFNRLVKPQVYTTIHPLIEEMTGITIDKLHNTKPFKDVYEEFIDFMGTESILCIWGVCDIKELIRNIEYHKLDSSLVPMLYIDIQRHASIYLDAPKGTSIGLKNAVRLLDIPLESQFHDAYNDAYYTAEVFKKIYNKDIRPNVYNVSENTHKNIKNSRNNNKKTKLDTTSLIQQFEKMFNKKMTKREKSIIRLAYNMGRTGQFQVEVDE